MPQHTLTLGEQTYRVSPLFTDRFAGDLSHWTDMGLGSKWSIREGHLFGEFRPGGSTIWLKPIFDGDLILSFDIETIAPRREDWADFGVPIEKVPPDQLEEGAKNLNLFFLCSGPQGENMLECYPRLMKEATGPNQQSDDRYRGYFFTFTYLWSRLRRLPKYELCSDRQDVRPQVGKVYHVQAMRHGKRLRYFLDGQLIHDYEDAHPHTRGQMGICIWRNSVKVSNVQVLRILDGD
jgi:hypothetical protein